MTLPLRMVLSLLVVSTCCLILSVAQSVPPTPPIKCTGTCSKGFICHNNDDSGTTRGTFDIAPLHQLYPTFQTQMPAADAGLGEHEHYYSFSLCEQPSVPTNTSEGMAKFCGLNDGNVAALQYTDWGTYETCEVVGRIPPTEPTVELLEDPQYPALGPLGLKFTFTANSSPDQEEDCSAGVKFMVNLRCPFFLNGYAPNPVVPIVQPPTTHNNALLLPLVGETYEVIANGLCEFTVDVDSVFACPLACLPVGGININDTNPDDVLPCQGTGICRDIRDEPAQLGCLCYSDRMGERCETPSSKSLTSSNAQTPLGVVAIVLLVLVLGITVALFKKLHFLHKQGGQLYADLNGPKDEAQPLELAEEK